MAEIIGSDRNDTIQGTNGRDAIFARGGDDIVFGNGDGDSIAGDTGNDFLSGGAGNDRLFGVEADSPNPGRGEIDRLVGGSGADLFSLGFRNGITKEAVVYYNDGNPNNNGKDDFAVIKDFNAQEDLVVLGGNREDYVVGPSANGFIASGDSIYLDTNKNGVFDRRDEFIAVFEGVRNLDLFGPAFSFEGGKIISDPIRRSPGGAPVDSPEDDGDALEEPIKGTSGKDKLTGNDADNIILGLEGNDVLKGLKGDDLLDGGKGKDRYIGGEGQDTFVISPKNGKAIVLDFEDKVDSIGLAHGLKFEDLTLKKRGRHTEIRLDDQSLALVRGIRPAQLQANDFVEVEYTRLEGMLVPSVVA